MDIFLMLAGPTAIVLGLLFAPKGFWKFKAARTSKIIEMMELSQSDELHKIKSALLSQPPTNSDYQLNKLITAIQYAVGRHDWYEEQRTKFVNNTLTTAGLVAAALAIFSENIKTLTAHQNASIMGVLATVVVAIIVVILEYNSQLDRDRPYRLVSDIRHWYFRYQLSGQAKHLEERMDFETVAQEQLEERKRFVESLLLNSDIVKSVREDIEQLYILLVLQHYKSESLQKMRWMFTYLVIVVSLELLVFGFLLLNPTFYA